LCCRVWWGVCWVWCDVWCGVVWRDVPSGEVFVGPSTQIHVRDGVLPLPLGRGVLALQPAGGQRRLRRGGGFEGCGGVVWRGVGAGERGWGIAGGVRK